MLFSFKKDLFHFWEAGTIGKHHYSAARDLSPSKTGLPVVRSDLSPFSPSFWDLN